MKIKLIGYDHIEHTLIVKFENGKMLKHESVNETENLNESTRWQVGTIDKK